MDKKLSKITLNNFFKHKNVVDDYDFKFKPTTMILKKHLKSWSGFIRWIPT